MTCEHALLPDGTAVIICRRGKRAQRFICDVDDKPVPRGSRGWQMAWRNIIIDLCDHCLSRYESEPAFQAFADKAIAKHYPTSPPQPCSVGRSDDRPSGRRGYGDG